VAAPIENVWFVIFYPDDFRSGEPGQCFVTGGLNQTLSPDASAYFVALIGASLIVPEDCRSERVMPRVQQDKTVHLSSETNCGN